MAYLRKNCNKKEGCKRNLNKQYLLKSSINSTLFSYHYLNFPINWSKPISIVINKLPNIAIWLLFRSYCSKNTNHSSNKHYNLKYIITKERSSFTQSIQINNYQTNLASWQYSRSIITTASLPIRGITIAWALIIILICIKFIVKTIAYLLFTNSIQES